MNAFFHSTDQNEKSNFGSVAFGLGEKTGIVLMSTQGSETSPVFCEHLSSGYSDLVWRMI